MLGADFSGGLIYACGWKTNCLRGVIGRGTIFDIAKQILLVTLMAVEGIMNFYVSHMSPIKRARVHKGSCVHCRDGQGQINQDRGGKTKPTGWSPPFKNVEAAKAYMDAQFPRYTDKGLCKHCKPGAD